MAKPKKRKCYRCGADMPDYIDFSNPDPNLRAYDQLKRGRKVQGGGTYTGLAVDICQSCMCDFEDNWLKNK